MCIRDRVNAVLIGGFNDDEIPALAELTRYYPMDVRFIELMPMTESEVFGANAYVSGDAVLKTLPQLTETVWDDGVAKLYRLPGAQGNIGLIRAAVSYTHLDVYKRQMPRYSVSQPMDRMAAISV